MWYFVINEQRGGATKSLNDDTGYHQEVKHAAQHLHVFNSSCIGDDGQKVPLWTATITSMATRACAPE
jgi:hypothetical protein